MALPEWLLDRLPARQRLTSDPLASLIARDARYLPVPITGLKLTGNLRGDVLGSRPTTCDFECSLAGRLAVIVPARGRDEQLAKFLPAIRARLSEQGIDHRIVIVEQQPGVLFNRAKNLNVGARAASQDADYFCFHDVDTLPIAADYRKPSQPLRLVKTLTETFRPINTITGYYFSGAISIRRDQFESVNGFANDYWGSGSQDEDFFYRLLLAGLVPHEDMAGVFTELDNPQQEAHYRTKRIRRANKRRMIWHCYRRTIGASGLSNLDYRVIDREQDGPVTRLRVQI